MSDTEKTRQKLMDTIRRTKAGAAGAPEEAPQAAAAEKPAPAARSKTAKPKAKPSPKPAANKSTPAKKSAGGGQDDAYQSGRRVWPD